ncbi:MAG: winged helix-turn-helix domain-containing protein [Chloroflexota bacterium]
MRRSIELSDPRSLRALAHPTRVALVGLLRQHGSLTATEAARLLKLDSGSCSFHLRQLARFGLVEEAGAQGRRKPWRATARVTSWPGMATDPEMESALQLLSGIVAQRYAQVVQEWLNTRSGEPQDWQRAAWFGDMLLHLTPDELTELGLQIEQLVAPYEQRVFEPESRPAGSRLVTALHIAIPREPDAVNRGEESS